MGGEAVSRVLTGAVDLHYHSAPSPFPRRLTATEAARHYAAAGFGGVVMKSHHHSTVMELIALRDAVLDELPVAVFGGIALNGAVGGLNPRAVDLALKMGGKVVWFPTIAGRAHLAWQRRHATGFPRAAIPLLDESPVDVLDGGRLKPEALQILELIGEADAILASGHIAGEEVEALFGAARERGLRKLLLNHPDFILELDDDLVAALVELGAFVEHILIRYDEQSHEAQPLELLLEWIRRIGPERTVISSDLGQLTMPLPADAFTRVVRGLLDAGVPEGAVTLMVRTNPRRLVGLEPW